MDLQIKTFRIQSEADERALNEFLVGKIVRHWDTTLSASSGEDSASAWNVFLAYEIRMNGDDRQSGARNSRQDHAAAPQARRTRDARRNDAPQERREARPVREKAPREEYQPQIPEKDLPLYEAVRKWRNARARDERVKPFELFNNKTLETLITTKPNNATDLKASVPEMEPRLWERYGNELLGFMEAAGTAGGQSDAALPTPSPESVAATN